jgi:hypothetical protein
MPACTECARYWSPRVAAAGRCPECGGAIARSSRVKKRSEAQQEAEPHGLVSRPHPAEGPQSESGHERLPWHLKLLGVSFCLYMGFRLYQGIVWLVHHV